MLLLLLSESFLFLLLFKPLSEYDFVLNNALNILIHSLANLGSNFEPLGSCKKNYFLRSRIIKAAIARFDCKTVGNLILLEDYSSCSIEFFCTNSENT